MKRLHVLSITFLAGLIMGAAIPAKAAAISCIDDAQAKPDSALILTIEGAKDDLQLKASTLSEKGVTPGLRYFYATSIDGNANWSGDIYTTRQAGQPMTTAANVLNLYIPKNQKAPNEFKVVTYFSDNNKVSNKHTYTCFDLSEGK